jgi:hypothetical protein
VHTSGGIAITAVVAAGIVAVKGMLDTARALTTEMDKRGVAHLTASITVNRPSMPDTLIYLARATVFHGELAIQGFGVDAKKYAGDTIVHKSGDNRLRLSYDGKPGGALPIQREAYAVRKEVVPSDIFA